MDPCTTINRQFNNGAITWADGECDFEGDIITHTCGVTIECDYVNYDGFASHIDVSSSTT